MMPKCRLCKAPDATKFGLSYFCGYAHAAKWGADKAKDKRGKSERKKTKDQLAVLNQTIPFWTKKAQHAFNNFIRNRDISLGCISCSNAGSEILEIRSSTVGGRWDCGHYLSVGAAPELRFSEDNAHKQCKRCNRQLSGNAIKYRAGLIERIGQHRVDILEGPHELPHWKWRHYKAVYDWYHTLNKLSKKGI